MIVYLCDPTIYETYGFIFSITPMIVLPYTKENTTKEMALSLYPGVLLHGTNIIKVEDTL